MIRNSIAYHIGLPLFDISKKYHVKQYYEFFKKTENWSPEQLNEYRTLKLRKLIAYAYNNVPFYKNRFDEIGLLPKHFKCIDDLKKIPPLTRKNIQINQSDLLSSAVNIKDCYRGSSSGSTGEPVVYYHDKSGSSAGLAALYYGWTKAGWRFGDRMLTIWGNPTTVNIDWKRKTSKLKALIFNEIKYPAYQLTTKKKFDDLFLVYSQKNIKAIQGYTNAIYLFADHIKETGQTVTKCKGVFTTAESLLQNQRDSIESVLGPVYDFYGCGEIMGIATQCKEKDKYHVIDTHVIVEFSDSVDDYGGRELLITDLDNLVMPLIRYKNGDAAVPAERHSCRCGLSNQTLGKVIGRLSDIIQCPGEGSLTVPSFFGSRLLKELRGFKQYQVELIKKNKLIVRIAVDSQFDKLQMEKVKHALNDYIPESMEWDIKLCASIKPDKAGKFKLLVDRTKN